MRSNLKYMFFTLCIVLVLSGCFPKKNIKLGFAGSLTGKSYELGIPAKNGFILAVEHINSQGGINGAKLIPVIKDDESSVETAYGVTEEFIEEDVEFVIGFLTSNMAPVIQKPRSDEQLFFVSPTISTNLLSDLDDYFVRVVSTSKYEGDAHVKVLTEYHDTTKVAVIYDMSNAQYSEPIYERFKTLYEEKGFTVVYTNTLTSESIDYEKIAVEIDSSGAQGVVLITNTIDASNIIQQLARKGNDLIITNSGWSVNYDLIERSGKASEGIYGIAAYIADYDGANYREFAREYEERFNETPFFSAHTSYDAVMALSQAMRQSKSLAIEDVKITLLSIKDFSGLQTDFSINEYGDATRSNMLLSVEDGKFILVQELD